jgi:hypothetical protein
MRPFLLSFLILACCGFAAAQDVTFKGSSFSIKKAGTVNLSSLKDDYAPTLQNLEMPKPGSKSTRGQLLKTKEELRKKYPVKNNASRVDSATGAIPPAVQRNFEGNLAGASVPNDNDMAISNNGMVVSVINTTIYVFDTNNDTLLLNKTLTAFAQPLMISGSKYDPKVSYDPVADRFIMVFLNGYTYQLSKIVIAFSETNDPTGNWNLYWITGNPLANNTWSDYPVIGISSEDLFIGVNTFTNGSSNNSGFTESCFWQIDKEEGYAGDTALTSRYYHDILTNTTPIFNITPIKGGKQPYGPYFYLLSNRNTAAENDSVFVMKVTGDVHNSSTTLQLTTLQGPKYILPPSARQPQGHTFDTNDSRILGGFLDNNTIQYVQGTLDTTTGFAAVYHGIIHDVGSSMSITANIIGDTLLDLGFPNISYTGIDPGETEAIITFNHVAPTVYSGFSGIYYANDGTYSPITTIKTGSAVIDLLSGTYERWGDYSGSQTKYNEPWKVWAAGSFGKSNGKHGTWIAELASSDSIQTYFPPAPVDPNFPATIYPNPTEDLVSINFTLEADMVLRFSLYDMRGRRVTTLLEDRAKKGMNAFSFSTQPLSNGMYILLIETEDGTVIRQEKIIRK